MKEDHDGAEPAASSVITANLLRLSALAAPEEAGRLRQRAAETVAAFKDRLEQSPHALTQMCCSLSLLTAGKWPWLAYVESLTEACHCITTASRGWSCFVPEGV